MKKITLFVMALLMMVTTSMAATKVAYIINTSYGTYSDGCSLDTDPILNALKASFEVEVIDLVDDTEADYTMISETYDVAVISEAMAGNGKLGIDEIDAITTNYNSWSGMKPNGTSNLITNNKKPLTAM